MVARRRGKRKSASKGYVFEVSDDDVSPDNSDNECNEPGKKILKSGSKFVESVVNALSNLENEAKKENSDTEIVEILDNTNESTQECSKNVEEGDVSVLIKEDTNESIQECSNNVEEGDVSVFIIEDSFIQEDRNSIKNNSQTISCPHNTENADETVLILNDSCSLEDLDCPSKSNQITEVLRCITPDLKFDETIEADVEEGELVTDTDKVDSSEPTIQITFSTKSLSDLYRSTFLKFLSSFPDLCTVNQDDLSITVQTDPTKKIDGVTLNETTGINDTILKYDSPSQSIPIDELLSSTDHSPSKRKKRKKAKKEKELFVLDTNPAQSANPVTKYSSKFQIDINDSNDGEEEEVRISAQTCFNCDQGHALKDCPLPRNHAKINMKRQQFKMKKDKLQSRYHLEEDQKFAHLKPGRISDTLREALGLQHNQLPPHIYQMRQLGYPPGWLEEAKFVYSNLALFDTEGKNVRAETAKKNQSLDPNKIVEYPGFNVPMDKNCKDEYRQHRAPPYSTDYNVKAMIQYFEKEYSKQQDDFEALDMDLDVTNEDTPRKEGLINILKSARRYEEKDAPSPSLVDLETQKQSLLAALDDSFNVKSEDTIGEAPNPETAEKEPLPPLNYQSSSQDDSTYENLTESSCAEFVKEAMEVTLDDSLDESVSKTAYIKTILNSNFGTPTLKSHSPYSRLPNPDNFMKDVSPVINFENLPNSTGKYEQMTDLLQKVRSTLRSVQKDDS